MNLVSANYGWCLDYLPGDLQSIVEVGSRDALDGIALSQYFDCQVTCFEPNPRSLSLCYENIQKFKAKNVTMRTEALSNEDGEVIFRPVNPEKYPNIGASSFFEIDFKNRSSLDPDKDHQPIQELIRVQAVRWDSLSIPDPELLLLDVEGAELLALEGFGDRLSVIQYIVCEVAPVPSLVGGCSFREIHNFLTSRGFCYVASDVSGPGYAALATWLFKRFLKDRLTNPWGPPRFLGQLNVIYRLKEDSGVNFEN